MSLKNVLSNEIMSLYIIKLNPITAKCLEEYGHNDINNNELHVNDPLSLMDLAVQLNEIAGGMEPFWLTGKILSTTILDLTAFYPKNELK